MPYSILTDSPDCDGYAVVKTGTTRVLGCHRTRREAARQIAAIEANEAEENNYRALPDNDLLDKDHPRYPKPEERQEGYVPTDAMVAEARRGLEWRAAFGRGGTEVGVARARDIVNRRRLSRTTIARMASFFARHAVDKRAQGFRPGEPGYPSAGRIAWALWGGDPGVAFSRSILANGRSLQDDTDIR